MKPVSLLTASALVPVAIAHLVRQALQLEVEIGGSVLPMWSSIPGFVVPGGLAFGLWRESRS